MQRVSTRPRGRRSFRSRLWALERLETRDLLAIITVNSAADGNNHDADSTLTYREAIRVANGDLAVSALTAAEQAQINGALNTGTGQPADTIAFNIAGSGVRTIVPAVPLPNITDPVIIDGYTQPGSDPNSLASGSNAILLIATQVPTITAGHSTIRGLVVTNGSIVLQGGSNSVEGNFIGTDALGNTAPSLAQGAPAQTGVWVESDSNTVGGSAPAARNLISGNNQIGVHINGGSANQIIGNLIGTNALGTQALGNGIGVWISNGANNSVGAATAGASNVISGNSVTGIRLAPEGGSDAVDATVIAGNLVGTNASGTTALGNGNGIFVNASNTTVGGTAAGAGNVVSGNPGGGVGIFQSTATLLQNNRIGTNAAGTLGLGNGDAGIVIGGSAGTTVGGSAAGARNVISGNNGHGISVNSPGAGTIIRGNFIGVTADGVNLLSNSGSGVRVVNSGPGVVIGGPSINDGNVIYYNGAGGVVVEAGTGVDIRTNSIYGNNGPGIDLGNDGDTPNDPDDSDGGPNNRQNWPQITLVTSSGSTSSITGTLSSTPNTVFTLQFFSNSFAAPTNFGQGQIFLGEAQVQTDGSGNVAFVAAVNAGVAGGQPVVGVAIDPSGNTSEFSVNVPFTPDPAADLAVTVSSNVNSVLAGQSATFTITVSNTGPNPASNVSMVAGLSAGSTLVSTSQSQGALSTITGAIEASLGTIASGSSATVTVVMTRPTAGTMSAAALAYSAASDPVAANNTALKNIDVLPVPDLATTVSAPAQSAVNQDVTFTFTITNTTNAPATNVVLTSDSLPSGATFVSSNSSQGSTSQNAGVVTATLGTIAANSQATVTIVLHVTGNGDLVYGATATLTEPDPNPDNNRAVATVAIVVPPDVTIAVIGQPNPVLVNHPITYTIEVKNLGTSEATSVVVNATLTPGGTFISADPSQGSATPGSGTITANLGTIAAGATASLVVVVTPSAAGVATISANVTSLVDANPDNNSATASVVVNALPNPVTVSDIHAITTSGGIRGYVLRFSSPVDPVTVSQPGAYRIVANGRTVPIKQIGYDVITFSVAIFTRTRLPSNSFVTVLARGIGTSAILSGPNTPIDGDSNGIAGGDFVVSVARGRRLRYSDGSGDIVNVNLVGLGAMEMIRGPEGNARVLRIFNASPRRSTLTGNVRRGPGGQGEGVTRIPVILGFNTVRNRLPAGRFIIG